MSDLVMELTSFGAFAEPDDQPALSRLGLQFNAVDLITEWSRCSTVADFVAGFLAGNFERRNTAEMVLSTVINELIENATKFGAGPQHPIAIEALHFGDTLRIQVSNVADAEQVRVFAGRLDELLAGDLDQLFVKRLQEPVTGIGRGAGIGLLILIKDYGAQIGARILPRAASQLYDVDVQVTLTSAEIEQR